MTGSACVESAILFALESEIRFAEHAVVGPHGVRQAEAPGTFVRLLDDIQAFHTVSMIADQQRGST